MTNTKFQTNTNDRKANDPNVAKRYDLEERTERFTRRVFDLVKGGSLKSIPNNEVVKQLSRSASSVGANYIEANEALSKKDFLMRIKICRKEAKESGYWIRLLDVMSGREGEQEILMDEAMQLVKIFNAIVEKSGMKQ